MLFNSKSTTGRPRCERFSAVVLCLLMSAVVAQASAQVVIDYTYDDLNRLTVVNRDDGPTVVYGYDVVSNIEVRWVSSSPDTDGDLEADFADDDDDNDLIPDVVEIENGLNPLLDSDAALDLDGDGISNLAEYLQGSDIDHKQGDLNNDNLVDVADVVVLKRIIFGKVLATPDQLELGHGDVNLNGGIDVGDLVITKRIVFGL